MDARTRRLVEAPIGPTLLRLAAPNVLVMLVQTSVGLIETYFVAGLGTDALAGIALVFPLLMLVQMISAGAMGGGIMSAVARTLGAGRNADADALVWHAAAIAAGFGLLTTLLALTLGAHLYGAMGGEGASLAAARAYSDVVFAGALFVWLFNSLAALIRGTGNMMLPACVMCAGAVVLIPLSPALIYGWGVLPRLGIVGGAVAVVAYYAVGTLVFALYLWRGRGVLQPPARPPRFRWEPARDILRVGLVSSVVSVTTNLTIGAATAFVGQHGPAAVAGFGTGSRLEYLLVPLIFGLGTPVGAMVGTSIGAGRPDRARRVAWYGAAFAGLITETIGIAAALVPHAWLTLFGQDPEMLAVGSRYLQVVGPFYGLFGAGLALYFACQGAGRVGWPLVAGLLRVLVAVGGGWLLLSATGRLDGVYAALAAGLATIGLVNGVAVWSGAWLRHGPTPTSLDAGSDVATAPIRLSAGRTA